LIEILSSRQRRAACFLLETANTHSVASKFLQTLAVWSAV